MRQIHRPVKAGTVTITADIEMEDGKTQKYEATYYLDKDSEMTIAEDFVFEDATQLGDAYKSEKPSDRVHYTLSLLNAKDRK